MRHKNEKNTSFSLWPRQGSGWGRGKESQKCFGISSKDVTTTARKTESDTTHAKLKRKKIPQNISTEERREGRGNYWSY